MMPKASINATQLHRCCLNGILVQVQVLPYSVWGGGQKGPPNSFFPVISTNVGISPQILLNFSCDPFATLL